MYKTDKIAILLATYNAGTFLSDQLNSIINQTNQDWTIFIHDDGSSDETLKVAKKFSEIYKDKIVIVEGAPTGCAQKNFFYLMKQVDAPIYMFCDQDDVWLPDKISTCKNKLGELTKKYTDEKPLLVSTDLKVVDQDMKCISDSMRIYSKIKMKESIPISKLLIQNYAVGCTLMYNRTLRNMTINSINDYIIMHDWWLALIASLFGYYENLPECTILYRQHENNSVGAQKINILYAIQKLSCIKKKHEIIKNTRNQVLELSKKFNITNNKIINGYANLNKKIKMYRIYFHIRYGINKQGILRKLGIILCC